MTENVHDTGYIPRQRNGQWEREVWFNRLGTLFKVEVHSESYHSQSYANLRMMCDRGWVFLASVNPYFEFGVDISSKKREEVEPADPFGPIIEHLKGLALIVADNLDRNGR